MNREKALLTRMAGTIIAIVACLAAMGFSAFAYFSHGVSSGMNTIQSAYFALEIVVGETEKEATTVDTEENEAIGVVLETDTYFCDAESIYKVVLSPGGTAKTGYCKIEIVSREGDVTETFYTTQMFSSSNEEITLTIHTAKVCALRFTPQWGTSKYYSVDQEKLYGTNENSTIICQGSDSATEYSGESNDQTKADRELEENRITTYTVLEKETLQSIAEKLGIDWETLAAYNHIRDADKIYSGQILNVPPEGWTMSVPLQSGEIDSDNSKTGGDLEIEE